MFNQFVPVTPRTCYRCKDINIFVYMKNNGERIAQIISEFCESKADFARKVREKPQTISNWVARDNGTNVLNKIIEVFPEVNMDWLMTGQGEMLKEAKQEKTIPQKSNIEGKTIPLLPISAQGGRLNEFIVSVRESECERVVSPIRDADFAIPISGDSMAPEYPNGSQVHVKKINEKAFIEWGRVYVLDTCNGTVIKRIAPSEKEGYVKCLSINPDPIYAPFEICLNDVYGIYRVMLCLSIK